MKDCKIKSFIYSARTLLSITDYEQKKKEETRRVNRLKGGIYSGWVVVPEETEYKLYHNDSQMLLKGCGKNSRKVA